MGKGNEAVFATSDKAGEKIGSFHILLVPSSATAAPHPIERERVVSCL